MLREGLTLTIMTIMSNPQQTICACVKPGICNPIYVKYWHFIPCFAYGRTSRCWIWLPLSIGLSTFCTRIQVIFWLLSAYMFDCTATHERLLLEIRVQHIEIYITQNWLFVYNSMIYKLLNTELKIYLINFK